MKRKFNELNDDDNIYDEIDLDKVNEYLTKWFIDKNVKIIDK
jgi:hypothetical protein